MHHAENAEEGADALDLACQTADALCQLPNPSVELLGILLLHHAQRLLHAAHSAVGLQLLQDSCHHHYLHAGGHAHESWSGVTHDF